MEIKISLLYYYYFINFVRYSYIKFKIKSTSVYVLTSKIWKMKKSSSENEKTEVVIKVYKRRWFVLFIFILYSAVNAFQWIQYPIIANIVTKYYNVSAQTVDWTSIIYMLLYPPLILPASYNVEKKVCI